VTDTTVDAFHRGGFALVQPRDGGHRAGMDALVLAAAVPTAFAGRVFDLGAGAGAVGIAVAARCKQAQVVLVENAPEMAAMASATLALPENAAIASRLSLLVADVTLTGAAREAAGLSRGSADFILMNPPFNDSRDRSTPNALRRQAHVMTEKLFDAWLKTAAAIAASGASVAVIARPSSLPELLAALDGRFGSAVLVPIHARSDREAVRIIVKARKGARGRLTLLPGLALRRGSDNRPSDHAEAISAGTASLFDD